MRIAVWVGLIGLAALGGCRPDLACGDLVEDKRERRCVCPASTVFDEENGICLLPDGGFIALEDGAMPRPSTDGCVPAVETCNGIDDDCDGDVDEAAASASCATVPGATRRACTAGACVVVECASGRDDCDGDYANGCEAELATDDAHCGGCGLACGPRDVCVAGACSASPGTQWVQSITGAGSVSGLRGAVGTTEALVFAARLTGSNQIAGRVFGSEVDAIVGRLDARGNPLWVTPFSSDDEVYVSALTTGPDDAAYACGGFRNRANLGTREVTAAGHASFVAKLSSPGVVEWASIIEGTRPVTCGAVALHHDRVVVGLVANGAFELNVAGMRVGLPGSENVVLATLDDLGSATGARVLSSASYLDVTALASTPDGVVFGGIISGAVRFSATVERDAVGGYAGRLADSGDVEWLTTFESGFYAPPAALHVAVDGAIVVAGYFYERISAGTTVLTAPPETSATYVVTLEPTGRTRWATAVPGDATGVASLGTDVLVLTTFAGSVDVGGEVRSSAGPTDCGLIAIRSRRPEWLASFGSVARDTCYSLASRGGSLTVLGTNGGAVSTPSVVIPHTSADDGFIWRFRAR